MLLWLEEAAIEIAMILAVAVGSFMLVAAVWSQLHGRLHLARRRPDQAPQQGVAQHGAPRRASDRPA